jgi:hypothetical protein
VRFTAQSNIELMSEKEILNFKPAARLEQVADHPPDRMEDRTHRIELCADSASSRDSARISETTTP